VDFPVQRNRRERQVSGVLRSFFWRSPGYR
jgi:hypothetical protein